MSHPNEYTGSLVPELGQMETLLRAKWFTYKKPALVPFNKYQELNFFYEVTHTAGNTEALANFGISPVKAGSSSKTGVSNVRNAVFSFYWIFSLVFSIQLLMR